MITLAVPMAGQSNFFPESKNKFTKLFSEIHGRPMVQVVLENLMTIQNSRFLFVINDADAKKYRLDNVLRMLTKNNCDVVTQIASTKGAICSLLLGIEYLDHENPILISNCDQIISHDLNRIMSFFLESKADGGIVCFDSVHPQWSYARLDDDDTLLETAEKDPISRNAIAGLYYFKRGRDFVESSMKSIEKSRSREGLFYTSLVYNEMILQGKQLVAYRISQTEYHSFYSPGKIQDFEHSLKGDRS